MTNALRKLTDQPRQLELILNKQENAMTKKPKSFTLTPTVYLTKLVDALGFEAAAKLTGRSTEHLRNTIKAGQCMLDLETAAKYHVQQREGKSSDACCIIHCKPDIRQAIKAMVESTGGKYHEVP